MRELHESQLQAYQEAARVALTDHAQSVSLPAVVADETTTEEEMYVPKILAELEKPDWKVDERVWQEAWEVPLRERAKAAFHDNEDQDEYDDGDSDNDDLEDTEEEEGEEKTTSATKPVKKTTVKKRIVATKAGKGLLKKKALSATKTGTTAATAGQRASRGRSRARRGGRGGATGATK